MHLAPSSQPSGPDPRLSGFNIRQNPTEAQIVGFIEAVIEQAPKKGPARSAMLIRFSVDERRFDGWLGSLEDMRERTGLIAKKPDVAVSAVAIQTAKETRHIFEFGHGEKITPAEREPVARGRQSKPDATLSPELNAELKELASSFVIPKMEEGRRRHFNDTEKKKIIRIRYLRGLISPSNREHFMTSNNFHDPQIVTWKRDLGYDGSTPLALGRADESETCTEREQAAVPTQRMVSPEESKGIGLNEAEEAELQTLITNLGLAPKIAGVIRHITRDQKIQLARIGELLQKKGRGELNRFLKTVDIVSPDYYRMIRPFKNTEVPGNEIAENARSEKLAEADSNSLPESISALSQEAAADKGGNRENDAAVIDETGMQSPILGQGDASDGAEEVHSSEAPTETSPAVESSRDPHSNNSPRPPSSSKGYHPLTTQNGDASSGHTVAKATPEPVAPRSPVRRIVVTPRAYGLPPGFKRPSWVHATSITNGAVNEQKERADAMSRGVLERVGIVISDDPTMQAVWHKIRISAQGDAPVLLRGQPGVGKEPFARAIHELHKKNDSVGYRSINSSGITETLAESELFGHEKGSFTGADKEKKGAFELVDGGGTIVLDEIGDMPMSQQAKLLRAIENREFIRVGSEKVRTLTNVKIIASTNRPLEKLIRMGLFRADLYSRLTAHEIQLPKLEERSMQHRIDLIEHFLRMLGKSLERKIGMTESALARLLQEDMQYRDNVRGLRNHLERACNVACLYAGREVDIELEHIEQTIPKTDPDAEASEQSGRRSETYFNKALSIRHSQDGMLLHAQISLPNIDQNSQDIVEAINVILCKGVVEQMGGNQSAAAEKLDITRGTLRNKLRLVFPRDSEDA